MASLSNSSLNAKTQLWDNYLDYIQSYDNVCRFVPEFTIDRYEFSPDNQRCNFVFTDGSTMSMNTYFAYTNS